MIDELKKWEIEVNESQTIDVLRKQLAGIVRTELESRAQGESVQTTVDPVDTKEGISTNSSAGTASQTSANNNTSSSRSSECSAESNSDDTESDMSDKGKLEFSLKNDDWSTFVERLEILFEAKETKDEMKAVNLLTRLDEEEFMLIRSLSTPKKPIEQTYEELVKSMSEHLDPKPSETMQRCIFNQTKQDELETVAEFAAKLKRLSLHCNFKDLNTALRDQFVCGIKDQETRVHLFKCTKLTYEDAFTEAVAREKAVQNAVSSIKTMGNSSTQEGIYALSYRQRRAGKPSNSEKLAQGQHHGSLHDKQGSSERVQRNSTATSDS